MTKKGSSKGSSKGSRNLRNILSNNCAVLYGVLVVAILNVIYYLTKNDMDTVIFLSLVGYVTSFFTTNMIYILGAAILFAFLFSEMKAKQFSFFEGAATMTASHARRRKRGKAPPRPSTTTEQKLVEGIGDDAGNKVQSKDRVDHATTTTNAFKDLSAIVGDKGLQSMTQDTVSLMKQQESLMESLKSMEPMINTTRGFLEKMNLSGLAK